MCQLQAILLVQVVLCEHSLCVSTCQLALENMKGMYLWFKAAGSRYESHKPYMAVDHLYFWLV